MAELVKLVFYDHSVCYHSLPWVDFREMTSDQVSNVYIFIYIHINKLNIIYMHINKTIHIHIYIHISYTEVCW